MKKQYKVIGFDADDTLWINETYFREIEADFAKLMAEYLPDEQAINRLFEIEIANLNLYGYGIKGFMLSMIETAHIISNGKLKGVHLENMLTLGKEFLDKPVELLPNVEQVLQKLSANGYKLIVATKGDLLDQERKLMRSGLEEYFHHVEVMSDKGLVNYRKLLAHLDIEANEFLMIGNSLKSDIIPPLELGCDAIHIPFHTTWIHEHVDDLGGLSNKYTELETITDLFTYLGISG
ncbi:HAD family hydrolase [Saccharicrinis aurantiacus]|uniref:HAD family hydrolase n=1 Tax=Saccharicrinis aurantiacus TaxID=1849719 RepID=UPI00083916AE|nr:HAD family hydrolase [Saccharicrinis aurantiacus]